MSRARSVKPKPAKVSSLTPAIPLRPFGGAAAIFAITLLAYIPVLHGGFIWDDDAYVTNNPTLRSLGGLWRIWTDPRATPQYYPLVHTTFWLEYHLWGADSAVGFHLVNVLLHATTAVLLWRLLRQLRIPWPWLAAIIFAIHPVNVESVAWITERKNVLSGFFYLLAFSTYLTFIGWHDEKDSSEESEGTEEANHSLPPPFFPQSSLSGYFTAFVFFLLALFSKTVTATLPAAVLLVLWWKRGRLRWRDVIPLLPFLAAGILMGSSTGYLEQTQIGAHGTEWSSLNALDRVLIAGRALWFYAGKLLLPIKLTFIYPRWTINRHEPWQYLYPAAALALLVALYVLRKRLGRGPLVAVLFFGGTLFPALGFANVYPMRYSFVADHFQYLAGIGLIALFTAAIAPLMRSPLNRVLAATAIITMLGGFTFARGFTYRDRITLWQDTIEKNPNSWMAHTNLGHALHAQGDDEGAWAQYQQSVALAPDVAETHLNAALGQAIHGSLDGAIEECRHAIAIDPAYAPAYCTMANAFLEKGDLGAAEQAARKSTEVAPRYAAGHFMLARALEQQGRLPQAVSEYSIDLAINPDDAPAHFHLADALVHLHQYPPAMEHYRASLVIDPNNAPAWTTLGNLLLAASQPDEAAKCFQKALRLDPNLVPARQGLQRAALSGATSVVSHN